jgi:tetratricopeptide (TPR) repeat protein
VIAYDIRMYKTFPKWLLLVMLASYVAFAQGDADESAEEDRGRPLRLDQVTERPREREIELSPAVTRLIDDEMLTDAERRSLRVFHGQWDKLDKPTVIEQATIAMIRLDPGDASLQDESVPALLRAEAALLRGEPGKAIGLIEEDDSAQASLLRARAMVSLGRNADAIGQLTRWRVVLQHESLDDAAELTAAAEAVVLLAELEGRPAQDYHLAVSMFAKARDQLDRYYWPAHIAEAKLLLSKENPQEASEALMAALQLNLRAAEAWSLLGTMSASYYNFDNAAKALGKLKAIEGATLPTALLDAHVRVMQRDVAGARQAIEPILQRYPHNPEAMVMDAAIHAIAYDEEATDAALARFDERYPGHALAHARVGDYLAGARQYEWSHRVLREAVERRPNWPEPRITLGLMLMQAGDPQAARIELREAVRLDPFNKRADNQLRLADAILGYETIETEHFVIRYKAGIDEVLARDMPAELERIYRDVTEVFQHRPPVKTQIDIMPDEQWFGVRITGMPDIWTIAACTGDVISLTPPRHGPKQRGPYNWANVVRHEYVHTVTLSQTANRIPHWFTEACAVSQETTGRTYDTCQLLASALHAGKLFPLDQINWGFVRPKTPRDRPLAYAQSDWMLEFIAVRFGHDAIVQMLNLFREGVSDVEAFERVTGQNAKQFMELFHAWAKQEVTAWGMDPPPDERITALLKRKDAHRAAELDSLLSEFPNQPDLLRLAAVRALDGDDALAAREAVLRYAAARPVDPWPHRQIVLLAGRTGRPAEAIASLEMLDRVDNESGSWSHQLALVHRARGELAQASAASQRALWREPYNATYRELAAALALQRKAVDEGVFHLESMAILEPDRATHQVRLAAAYAMANRPDDARAAAVRARAIDPAAPVERFLD